MSRGGVWGDVIITRALSTSSELHSPQSPWASRTHGGQGGGQGAAPLPDEAVVSRGGGLPGLSGQSRLLSFWDTPALPSPSAFALGAGIIRVAQGPSITSRGPTSGLQPASLPCRPSLATLSWTGPQALASPGPGLRQGGRPGVELQAWTPSAWRSSRQGVGGRGDTHLVHMGPRGQPGPPRHRKAQVGRAGTSSRPAPLSLHSRCQPGKASAWGPRCPPGKSGQGGKGHQRGVPPGRRGACQEQGVLSAGSSRSSRDPLGKPAWLGPATPAHRLPICTHTALWGPLWESGLSET